jgi:hypothetical protein
MSEHEDRDRYGLYALCPCAACGTTGKVEGVKCADCRGEGRQLREVCSVRTVGAIGTALVTCAREGEWSDGCQFGLLDREGEINQKWLVLPWPDTPRTVTAAARTLARSKRSSV